MKFINLSVEELHALAKSKHQEYESADPFPTIMSSARKDSLKYLDEFPDMIKRPGFKYEETNQVKLASKGEYRFGEESKEFMHFLNSQPFLEFLSILTSFDALISGPYFEGGCCHQIMPGGPC